MKKILILSYHFSPMNVIASKRAEAYANYLKSEGYFPTIVTHLWELENEESSKWLIHSEGQEIVYEYNDDYNVIRIPRVLTKKGRLATKLTTNRLTNRYHIFKSHLNGDLDVNPLLLDSENNFTSFLMEHLKENEYDVLLGIFSPHNHLRTCYEVHKKFNIPYLIDFRDIWSNNLLRKEYNFSFSEKLFNYFIARKWKKWLGNSKGFVTVSEPIRKIISQEVGEKKSWVITNGYESELFDKFTYKPNKEFTIAHVGTIYKDQRLDLFFGAISKFVSSTNNAIKLKFVGVKPDFKTRLLDLANTYNLANNIELISRVPREEALEIMYNADLLFYPAWENEVGIYSGKIFEYLGSGVPILVTPTDANVVEELVEETKSGIATSKEAEVLDFLQKQYSDFKGKNGKRVKNSAIENYTREAQVKKIAKILKSL